MVYLNKIPLLVLKTLEILEKSGFPSYLVGGCVRDLILNKEPKDWDITTKARPEDIQKIFLDSFYDNAFGTVSVIYRKEKEGIEKDFIIQITPFRTESVYTDNRHPDTVLFSEKVEDDLKRRDLTINSIALRIKDNKEEIIDLYGGIQDLKDRIIKAVGTADERFKEDSLRVFRAIRFSAQLDFEIEAFTLLAMKNNGFLLENISKERIRDEFEKIIMSKKPKKALELCLKLGILEYISPELVNSVGIEQNQAHSYDVWNHLLFSLQHSADKNWPFHVRLSALFHDISKPETRRFSHETKQWTFYGHDVIGSRVTRDILNRLKFPSNLVNTVKKMVRWHMFFSDTEEITLSAVRRLVVNVGEDLIWDLINLRICDRVGTGRPKEEPYRLRKFQTMIEQALRSPISLKKLAINGDILIKELNIPAGKILGDILNALFYFVIDKPENNNKDYLLEKSKELMSVSRVTLEDFAKKGREIMRDKEEEEIKQINKEYHVS